MKKLGILLILTLATAFTPAKGYSKIKFEAIENHPEKIYVKLSELDFSVEGIFLRTSDDVWMPIDQISYDSQGYYIEINGIKFAMEEELDNESDNSQEIHWHDVEIIKCGSRLSEEQHKWKCPYCGRWWLMGEKCRYKGCPTNQWTKENEES